MPGPSGGKAGCGGVSASPAGRWSGLYPKHWFCSWCDIQIISRPWKRWGFLPSPSRSKTCSTVYDHQVTLWDRKRIHSPKMEEELRAARS